MNQEGEADRMRGATAQKAGPGANAGANAGTRADGEPAAAARGRRLVGAFPVLVAIFVVILAVTAGPAPVAAQWHKNKYQLERDAAAHYEPSPFGAERKASGPVQVLRVRFYADGDYRSGGHWRDGIKRQLADMNGMLMAAFGVRLEAESVRRWERAGGNGALAPMLKELEALDRGADVDWVVGLVSPLPLVSMSFHDLGYAAVLGRHFVLRGMSSVAELDAFHNAFQALDRTQREKLYSRRKAHKEMAVLLHEWAHTLGAFHVEDPTSIMGPGYSQRSSRFSAADADLVAAGLQARIASRGKERVDWTPLRERLGGLRSPAWHAAEVASLSAQLDNQAAHFAAAGASKPSAVPAPAPVLEPAAAALGFKAIAPAADKGLARKAQQALEAGRAGEARATVEEGLRGHPRSPELLIVACDIELREHRTDKAARHCAAALAVSPSEARAHHLMGQIHLERRKPDAAITSLVRAIELEPGNHGAWELLGQTYRAQGRSREFQKFILDHAEATPAPPK